MTHHLVILNRTYLQAIISGEKSFECRLSQNRNKPYDAVRRGDTLWLKRSGGPVVATARVRSVSFFRRESVELVRLIRKRFGRQIQAGPRFFSRHRNARYATIIRLRLVRRVRPFSVAKRDRRAWVVLGGEASWS